MGIPASELTAMQTAVNATLDQSCTIKRNTPTTSNWATQTDSFSTVATVNCHLAKPTASMAAMYADKIGTLASWLVRFPYGTDVQDSNASHGADQLVIGSTTLKVVALLSPRSYPVALLVLAAEVE